MTLTANNLPRRRWPRRVALVLGIGVLVGLIVYGGNDALRRLDSDAPSRSIGATNSGRLVNGKRLPSSGANFSTYSRFGSLLGRTTVNGRVRDAMLAAYAALRVDQPQTWFIYGETGWPHGGRFRPHRTHQNGLSVDFMVPVRRAGRPAVLPTGLFNKFGYGIAFDADGRSGDLVIDFAAMAAHLDQLDRAAQANGLAIEVVIFAPDLQDNLAATILGGELKQRLRFSRKPSWVRHDDHYHVDFRLTRP